MCTKVHAEFPALACRLREGHQGEHIYGNGRPPMICPMHLLSMPCEWCEPGIRDEVKPDAE